MRVVQIVPSLDERHGGPSKSVRRLSAALADLGNDVSLLATDAGPGSAANERRLGIEIFHRDWPQRLCLSRGLNRRLGELTPDVVHHHSVWLRTLNYAHRRAAALGVPLVISARGMMAGWARSRRSWRKGIARLLIHPGALAGAAGWHATSEQEAADLRRCGFTQPICVAPNGIDAPLPGDEEAAAQHWHDLVPETTGRPVALFYSRFHRKKRLLELIDAWLEHGPKDWLLLVAGIPQEYSARMLGEYVLRASGGGRVQVFDGVGHPPPYAVASLFLLPSHDENFGMVIAEALAHGVPAIVTDTTPWQGLNQHGGWCVPWSEFPRTMRAAAAEGRDRLRARGSQSREWVNREYSWERPAGLLAKFYESLRGRAGAGGR